mgnify:FL=1
MDSVVLPKQQTEPESSTVAPASKHSRISGIVPVDAIAHAVVKHSPSTSEPAVASAAVVESDAAAGASKSAENVQSEDTQPEIAQPATAQSETDQPAADVPDDQQRTAAEAYQESTAAGVADQQPSAETETAQQSVSEASDIYSTGVHTPVFEPGSVFERVAKGELKAQEPAVEVDGLTSDEAKTTQDFNVQFEVARHPELLAFLAMNPYLYDDMYSWLAARGEADIDEALSHNKGYQEYREAVGK